MNLLNKYIELFIAIWIKLVNLSLMEGSMEGSMDSLKSAVLLPLIKDLDEYIDRDNIKHYRPVSKLHSMA